MNDVRAHARWVLDATTYVVLGTADANGHPWTTPVWFAPDGVERLYWLSWPGARHSLAIEQRPEIAQTVFDSHAPPGEGAAFYATARAGPCAGEQLDRGLETYNRRTVAHGAGSFGRDRVTGSSRLRLYVADYVDRWILDQDASVDRRRAVL